MKKHTLSLLILGLLLSNNFQLNACSVIYYVDANTGHIYVANNEDYWYDVKSFIQIVPVSTTEYARLWYGWNKTAQGGVNQFGLFFDGAVSPKQEFNIKRPPIKRDLGDQILATCTSVEQAIAYLNKHQVILNDAHIMFGDNSGNAAVVEWIDGQQCITWIKNNQLVMTNFLLADTTKGNYPCYRYNTIKENLQLLENTPNNISLLTVGNCLGKAAQPPKKDEKGKIGGTLYSSFIDITEMKFFLAYKLDNSKVIKLDLKKEFAYSKKRRIKLYRSNTFSKN